MVVVVVGGCFLLKAVFSCMLLFFTPKCCRALYIYLVYIYLGCLSEPVLLLLVYSSSGSMIVVLVARYQKRLRAHFFLTLVF